MPPNDASPPGAPDAGRARASTGVAGPLVTDRGVALRVPRDAAPGGVRLEADWMLEVDPEFAAEGSAWTLRLPRPAAHRLEYQLTLRRPEGDARMPDPTNPLRVPGPFGDKSEVRFPDYGEPDWLVTEAAGRLESVELAAGALAVPVPVALWSPVGLAPGVPAPLLLVHDGSDMAARGSLLSWAARHVATDGPLRVALLDPPVGYRNTWYSADRGYSDHLAEVVLPVLRERVAVSAVVGLGASLGALALLDLHRRHPLAADALALQSGSFFTPELDPQESGYAFFDQVCSAVAAIARTPPARTVPVLLTCGAIEENRANNELMAATLAGQGYPVAAGIVPDAHTMIGWRDAWAPGLDTLIGQVR